MKSLPVNAAGAHPSWPAIVLRLRDASVLFFFVSGWAFFVAAARREAARIRSQGEG